MKCINCGYEPKPTCACKEPMIYPEQKGGNCGYCGKPVAEKECERCIHRDMPCAEGEINCSGFIPQECKQIEELKFKPDVSEAYAELANKINELIQAHNRGE